MYPTFAKLRISKWCRRILMTLYLRKVDPGMVNGSINDDKSTSSFICIHFLLIKKVNKVINIHTLLFIFININV